VTPLLAQRPRVDRAFERLYRKHVHAVYRYCLAVLHNQADAEDVTQITFLSAYRAFQRGERPERAHNWLIKIAHNACRQRFRDSQRRPQEVAFSAEDAIPAPQPDDEVPTADEIRRALGFLSFNQRAGLVMRELEGRSYAEIGDTLELSISAVETLLFRARRALREQLEGGLTCEQTERTLAQLDERRLRPDERGRLRAHLRECKDCASLERRRRAQRAALKHLAAAPLPASLSSFFGSGAAGGGFVVGGAGLGAKAAAVLTAGIVSVGVGQELSDAPAASKRKLDKAAQEAPLKVDGSFSPLVTLTGGGAAAIALVAPGAELTVGSGPPAAFPASSRLADSSTRRRLRDISPDDPATGRTAVREPEAEAEASNSPTEPVDSTTRAVTRTVPVRIPPPPRVPVPVPPPPPVKVPPPPPLPPVPPLPPLPPPPPVTVPLPPPPPPPLP
jgi:RNA polymerase sigma factor (sigma-70 family)